jgi:hydrogenase maturation factor
MKNALLLCTLVLAACSDDRTKTSWTETVADRANLTLLHESDATGDWVTVIDQRHVELCMFSIDSNERLDYNFIAHVCGFEGI